MGSHPQTPAVRRCLRANALETSPDQRHSLYIVIYSLFSPVTALFSVVLQKSQSSPLKIVGIVISLVGGGLAMSEKLVNIQANFGFGDLLILLFTNMMAAHLVGSVDIVKRFGAMTANTVMFGSSALLLAVAALAWGHLPTDGLSMPIASSVLYIGVATASVFLLRYRALQSISPATVAVYQNLTPVFAVLFAHVFLGEAIQFITTVGGAIILLGAELVRQANQPQLSPSYLWAKRRLGSLAGHRISA